MDKHFTPPKSPTVTLAERILEGYPNAIGLSQHSLQSLIKHWNEAHPQTTVNTMMMKEALTTRGMKITESSPNIAPNITQSIEETSAKIFKLLRFDTQSANHTAVIQKLWSQIDHFVNNQDIALICAELRRIIIATDSVDISIFFARIEEIRKKAQRQSMPVAA